MSSWQTAICIRHTYYATNYASYHLVLVHFQPQLCWMLDLMSLCCLFPTMHLLSLLSQVYKVCWSVSGEPREEQEGKGRREQVTHLFLGLWTGGRNHVMSALVEWCMTSRPRCFLNTFFFLLFLFDFTVELTTGISCPRADPAAHPQTMRSFWL